MSKSRVVVPYTTGGLHPNVGKLAAKLGAEFVFMDTPTSYFELLERLWTGERDFVLWEQDVEPSLRLVEAMIKCPHDWCAGVFAKRPRWEVAEGRGPWKCKLGLNKFSARLQQAVPAAMVRAARLAPERYWMFLDFVLLERILEAEEHRQPHLHLPAMQHYSTEKSSAPLVEGELEAALRRIEQSPLMLGTARHKDDMLFDSRTGLQTLHGLGDNPE